MNEREYQDQIFDEATSIVAKMNDDPTTHPNLLSRDAFAREAAYRAILRERVGKRLFPDDR